MGNNPSEFEGDLNRPVENITQEEFLVVVLAVVIVSFILIIYSLIIYWILGYAGKLYMKKMERDNITQQQIK